MTTQPEAPAPSAFTFDDLPEALAANVKRLGWATPMEVQAQAIPIVSSGKDLITQSRTGSGKTAAFLLPLLMKIDPTKSGCRALILVPTRELAIQVHAELGRLNAGEPIRTALLYGGVGYGKQLKDLESGAQVVVGTPGRVLDHLGRDTLKLRDLDYLVLDEADEMLSMGFYPAMRKLRRYLPERRQSLMFSATMPKAVRILSKEFLYHPEFLTLSGDNVGVDTLSHEYFLVDPMEKDRALVRLLEMENPGAALIFCNRKSDVEYLYQFLQNAGYDVDRISGDLTQRARETVMKMIRDRKVRFLVATDVAARGIDIQDLDIVFQYEVPQDQEVYVHRAGRTARAGKVGRCITLVTYRDEGMLTQIGSRYRLVMDKRELPDLESVSQRVCERTTVFLEEQLRDAGSISSERIDRFVPLAEELSAAPENMRLLAMLLDEFYHRSLHLPPQLPEEKIRFEEIPDRKTRKPAGGRPARKGGNRDQRDNRRSPRKPEGNQ